MGLCSNQFIRLVLTYQLLITGVITTLRLLFARQAKGKRKLVLSGFNANYEECAGFVQRSFGFSAVVCYVPNPYIPTHPKCINSRCLEHGGTTQAGNRRLPARRSRLHTPRE